MSAPETETLEKLLVHHAGVLTGRRHRELLAGGRLRRNGGPFDPSDAPEVGDRIEIEGQGWRVIEGGGRGRLQVEPADPALPPVIGGPVRLHAGYHKCMTEFSKRVYGRLCHAPVQFGTSFHHFYHRRDAFMRYASLHRISSLSGQCIDLDRFADIRVVRFVRDPRDLLVSAYHYHRRGAEPWCEYKDPVDLDWQMVHGAVPERLRPGESLRDHLHRVPLQDGLEAELEFRRYHFDSMRTWPVEDSRVLVLRYEEVLGNEAASFRQIARFFGLPFRVSAAAAYYARRYGAGRRGGKRGHIRNAAGGQWRESFGPALKKRFNNAYGDLLERYGYSMR